MIALHLIAGFIAAALITCGLNAVALIQWRRSTGQHWTERARLLYAARATALMNLLRVPGIVTLSDSLLTSGDVLASVALAAFFGAFVGNYRLDREVYPGLKLRSWLSLAAVSFTFHLGLWMVPLAAAVMMPPELSAGSLLLVAALFAFNLFVAMDGWIHPLRRLGMIRPAPANITRLVHEQAAAKGICVNGVWVLNVPVSNAFASVFRSEVGFTSRLLEEHPEPEIAAIVAHELGHLSESRWARAGRLLTAFVLFPFVLLQPAIEVYGLRGVASVLLAIIVLLWFRGRLLRRMELRADKLALDGDTGSRAYAQALARLYETNQIPAVMPKRSRMPHPDLYERMLAAGVTPDFARPTPAPAQTWTGRLLTVALVGLLAARIAVDTMENGPSPASLAAPEDLATGQTAPAN